MTDGTDSTGKPTVESLLEMIGAELSCQETCGNCGDYERHRLAENEIRWTATGDALCWECGEMRGATATEACAGCEAATQAAINEVANLRTDLFRYRTAAAAERENVQRLMDALGVSPTSDEPLMDTIIREIGRLKAQ